MPTQKSCARKALRTLTQQHVDDTDDEAAGLSQEASEIDSAENDDDNDNDNDGDGDGDGDDDEPAPKKQRLSGPLRGLDMCNILTPPTTAPTAKTSSGDDSTISHTRHSTRGTAHSKLNVNYNMKYHPMDDFTRPKRAAKALGLQYDSASPAGSDWSGGEEQDEAEAYDEDDFDMRYVQLQQQMTTREPDPKACRRSSRSGASKPVLYNAKIHPQDYALFTDRKNVGSRRRSKPKSRKQSDVVELSSTVADSDAEEESSTEDVQDSQHEGDEIATLAVSEAANDVEEASGAEDVLNTRHGSCAIETVASPEDVSGYDEASRAEDIQQLQHGLDEAEVAAVSESKDNFGTDQYIEGIDTGARKTMGVTATADLQDTAAYRRASYQAEGEMTAEKPERKAIRKLGKTAVTIPVVMSEEETEDEISSDEQESEEEDPNENPEQLALVAHMQKANTAIESEADYLRQTQNQVNDAYLKKPVPSFVAVMNATVPESSQMPKRHKIMQPNAMPRMPGNSEEQKTSSRTSSGSSGAQGGLMHSHFDDQMAVTEPHEPFISSFSPVNVRHEAMGYLIAGNELDDELLAGIDNARDEPSYED